MQVFITGTDTNIGKTLTCAWLCAHTQYAYFKPIQTGIEDEVDSNTIQRLSPKTQIIPEVYALPRPLSPHLSAQYANIEIDINTIQKPKQHHVFIEGAGGLMVPINKTTLMIDLIKQLQVPVLLIASTRLGTINHTLLSLQALRQHDISILGVIMNGEPNPDNVKAVEYYGKTNVLGTLPMLQTITTETLLQTPLPSPLTHLLENMA